MTASQTQTSRLPIPLPAPLPTAVAEDPDRTLPQELHALWRRCTTSNALLRTSTLLAATWLVRRNGRCAPTTALVRDTFSGRRCRLSRAEIANSTTALRRGLRRDRP